MERNYELYHYGVPGMKWGVRKGNVKGAYEKASRKLEKLDRKVEKRLQKAQKLTMKADRKFMNREAYQEMADNARRKAMKSVMKAQKWVNSMDKTFKGTTQSLSKEQIDMGKKYAEILNMRVMANQYRR